MKPLLVIGAGSFAVEVEELARLLGYNDIAFWMINRILPGVRLWLAVWMIYLI